MSSHTHSPPLAEDDLGILSETASKLERLRDLARKYSVSDGSKVEEETEALESHEVIELQAFVRHKEWIDQKIQFLESLPAIDIFVGVDKLPKTYDQITTLPTRAQVEQWVNEHDKIEKETEVLDAGDLKKLKTLTKAATQRNLSPEDTDLIEITLITLFSFDKLLHLLRDRSEQLDLFNTRLIWEEQRALAYSTRDELISQIHSFLSDRARWRTDIYNVDHISNTTSSAGVASGSIPPLPHDPFSRATRFKTSEALSREIVQLSSRVSSLRHGPVLSSGRALDKLIEDGRKPVPDAMIDEQDRVEDRCEKDLTSVGKFLMTVSLQWQKADEIYVETRKDFTGLQTLSDDLRKASTEVPSHKSEAMFNNRVQTLRKRLDSRSEKPLASVVPSPKHFLFPNQETINTEIINLLSEELNRTRSLLSSVESSISSYKAGCDALDETDRLRSDILSLQKEVQATTDRLLYGFETEDGNGAPPDLSQNNCVEPMRCSVFLASLPALTEQSCQFEESALKAIKRARLSSLRLDKPGIPSEYRQDFIGDIEELERLVQAMADTRKHVSAKVNELNEVRRIWSAMDEATKDVDATTPEITEALLKNQWRQQIGTDSAPPTPESPTAELPAAPITPEAINEQITSIRRRLEQGISAPLANVRSTVPPSLYDFMYTRKLSIERSIFDLESSLRLLVDVRDQRYAMEVIREEVHSLEHRIEDSKIRYDDHFECILKDPEQDSGSPSSSSVPRPPEQDDFNDKEQALSQTVDSVENDVTTLVGSLPIRVPLVARRHSSLSGRTQSGVSRATLLSRLSFNPSAVDRSVRNDTNAYSIRLTTGVKSLKQKRSFGAFYRAARDTNRRVVLAQKELRMLSDQLEQHAKEIDELTDGHVDNADDGLGAITALKECLESLGDVEAERLRSSIKSIRGGISRMEAVPCIHEDSIANATLKARLRTFDDLNGQSLRVFDKLEMLKGDAAKAERVEIANLAEIARRKKEAEEAEAREQARRQEEQEEAEKRERERLEREANFRIQDQSTPRRDLKGKPFALEDDVFGPGSTSRQAIDKETVELLSLVRSLRKRLKSIGLNSVVRPSGASRHRSPSASLPRLETAEAMASDFALLEAETSRLPASAENITANTELRSLRLEMEASRELLSRVEQLARLQTSIAACDTTFSTFLDYIDSYPNEPLPEDGEVTHSTSSGLESPQDRLSARMAHAKNVFSDLSEHFAPVADDPRAIAEHGRLKQTWEELSEMALEKINGRPSRAPTALSNYNSSGRNSSVSSRSAAASEVKRSRYNNLSVSEREGFLAPVMSAQRRATSASSAGSGKQSRQPSGSRPGPPAAGTAPTARSVSGPMRPMTPTVVTRPNSSLFNSTFASRQRTSSVSSNVSAASTSKPPPTRRRMSSALSEVSRAASPAPSMASTRGTCSKAPRQSFGSFQRASTPEKTLRKQRQKYVANPKNKLDVALGDVINNLPVDINVEAVKDTWKDKSGKYWIGGSEPRLCFCRILRSQTVMVRVGGGWTELSKFIKDHFADLFRLLPETPPRPSSASKEQRWISAATLRNTEDDASLTKSSGSPDSSGRNIPSFAISTPDGTNKSPGSPGSSPLRPFQIIRRADANASEISLASLALSNDLSTSAVSTASIQIRPGRRRMSSTSSKLAWKP